MIKSRRGLYWPEYEAEGHEDVEDYIVRRMTDADVASSFVRTKGLALQAGGHVGLFPWQLAKVFGFVHTFEAVPAMYECLQLNTKLIPNIVTHYSALGDRDAIVRMEPRRSGRSKVAMQGIAVPQTTIDGQALVRCDLIYLDVEGYELKVLEGAKHTIEKYRPVIAIEVLKKEGQYEAVEQWIKANKYSLGKRVHSDWILLPC